MGCPRGAMVKAMDCGIIVREFVLQSRYYVHFRANILGSSRRMALALNNLKRVDMPLNKETKTKQPTIIAHHVDPCSSLMKNAHGVQTTSESLVSLSEGLLT